LIALDTNVIVRYIAQDDARQSALATRMMEKTLAADNPGFISLVTLCEVAWVLEGCYDAGRDRIRQVVEGLLGTKQLQLESPELVWKALRAWQGTTADLSDAIIGQVAQAHGATRVVTFDKAASRLPGFEFLA
jgi:predicted nucleic-acid-binding protein